MRALGWFALVWLLLAMFPVVLSVWLGLPAMYSYLFGIFLIAGVMVAAPAPHCPHCGRKWSGP